MQVQTQPHEIVGDNQNYLQHKKNGGINIDFHDGDGDCLDIGDNFDEGDDLDDDDDDEDLVGHIQEGLGIHGDACSSSSEKSFTSLPCASSFQISPNNKVSLIR